MKSKTYDIGIVSQRSQVEVTNRQNCVEYKVLSGCCSEAGECPEYYPDEFYELEDPRVYSEYYGFTNDEIFSDIAYNLAYCRDNIETPWQEEYKIFCESEDFNDCDIIWYSVEDEIKRCDKVNRKRKKHKNDIKTDFIKDKTYWIEDELAGLQIYIKHKYHKHKRAEKVFTEEESEQYFSYYEWYDHDGYLAYIPVESCEGNGNCLYGTCMSCDWDKDMYGLSWDDHDFIEYWDYPDYWHSEVKKSYSENGATSSADNLPFCRNTVLPSWQQEVYEMVEFFDQFK